MSLILLELVIIALLVGRRLIGLFFERRRNRQRREARRLIKGYLVGRTSAHEVQARISTQMLIEQAARLKGVSSDQQRQRLRGLATKLEVTQLRPMLRSRLRKKRLRVIYLLTFFDDSEVEQALTERLFEDPEPEIRLAAAKALAQMERLPPLSPVLDALDQSIRNRSRVVQAILRSLPVQRMDELEALYDESSDWRLRLLAIDALGHAGETSLECLQRATDDPSLEVRAAALRAIGRLKLFSAASDVQAKLVDDAWQVRCQAARVVDILQIDAAVPRLREMLHEKSWWVRFRAAESLYALGPRGREVLADIAEKKDEAGDVAYTVLQERHGGLA